MKLDLTNPKFSYTDEYKEQCDNCKKNHSLRTQKDQVPEYYTDVYILCDCDDHVKFSLPVN